MLESELISIGKIAGVFGVKGWVKIFSLTDPRENVLNYSPWILKKDNQVKEVQLVEGKRQGKTVVACLEGISDRSLAESYSNWEILINKSQLPEAEEGEYYWADLVGLSVETENGISLGQVEYIIETGANDVLVVQDLKEERLIPFLQGQTIKKIDLDGKLMVVDWDPDF